MRQFIAVELASLMLLGATGGVEAGTWQLARNTNTELRRIDCGLTLKARQALSRDHLLSGANLGVSVHDRVATVWGQVASPSLARRAYEVVRRVPGIAEVVNELAVVAPADPRTHPIPELRPQRPPVEIATASPTFGQIAGRELIRPGFESDLAWSPTQATPGGRSTPPRWRPAAVDRIPDSLPDVAVAAPRITLMSPVAYCEPAKPADDLTSTVERLRQADHRFQGIQADVQQGTIALKGYLDRWEDIHVLARSIARLPQVQRVLLADLRLRQVP